MKKFQLNDKVKVLDNEGSINQVDDIGIITEIGAVDDYRVTVKDRVNMGNWISENALELVEAASQEFTGSDVTPSNAKRDASQMVLDVLANVDQSYIKALGVAIFTVEQIIKAIPPDVIDEHWSSNQELRHWDRVRLELKNMKQKSFI
jgi:CRISPR/Cas system CSM-associated protein Csm5 (group 7 of RAMP superfamily)